METLDFFEQTAARWKNLYEAEDLYARLYQARAEAVLAAVDALKLPSGARVLDVGCGPGRIATALALRGLEVTAVDPVADMLSFTRRLARREGVSDCVRVVRADIRALPFPAGAFDLVVAIGIMEWMESAVPPLRELSRVAAAEAQLVVTTDNRWALHHVLDPRSSPALAPLAGRLHRWTRRWRKSPARRSQLHTICRFNGWLGEAGLRSVGSRTLGFGPYTFVGLRLVPDWLGWRVHQKLQALADRGVPLLRGGGHVYLVRCAKPV